MKISYSILIFFLGWFSSGLTQDTLIFKPDSVCGQDAFIWQLSNQSGAFGPTETNNFGNSPSFIVHEWTWNGDPGRRWPLINFDFGQIPIGATIIDARLDLFAFPNSPDGGHSNLSGSNQVVIQRITQPWEEGTVNWINQPTTTTVSEVFLNPSITDSDNYLDIDVTNICQDIVDSPQNSFGFMFSMVENSYYRSMVFASSDHPDPSMHPRLTIIYSIQNQTPDVFLDLSDSTICEETSLIYNVSGPCRSYEWSTGSTSPEIEINDPGTYWVTVNTQSGTYTDSFDIQVVDCNCDDIFIPTAFSPNNDISNDMECVYGSCISNMTFQIYNRWGQMVFESTDKEMCWDGTFEGKALDPAVFYYVLEGTLPNGAPVVKTGNITLVK